MIQDSVGGSVWRLVAWLGSSVVGRGLLSGHQPKPRHPKSVIKPHDDPHRQHEAWSNDVVRFEGAPEYVAS